MYKIKYENKLIDIMPKIVYVKKDEKTGVFKIIHDENKADGIVVDGITYNVEKGPSNIPGAKTVSIKKVLDPLYLEKLNSARVIAESRLAALNNAIEEANKTLSDLEGAILDLDPENK